MPGRQAIAMSEQDGEERRRARLEARRAKLRMERTTFSERVLPAFLIGLGIFTVLLILLAVGILLGITPWR
jgi:hypothetical protein